MTFPGPTQAETPTTTMTQTRRRKEKKKLGKDLCMLRPEEEKKAPREENVDRKCSFQT